MTGITRTPIPHAAASFASAFLLFLVQPMIAKAVIPVHGGTASVWNSALLIGQVLLLFGSFYAYRIIDARFPATPRHANLVVTLAVISALVALPAYAVMRPVPSFVSGLPPEIGVPLLMLATVGPGMLLLGAQSTLIQRSYSVTAGEANPYPLYAASNAGSLLGLLAYPFLFEPLMGTREQIILWEAAVVLVLLANSLLMSFGAPLRQEIREEEDLPRIGPKAAWIIPAFLATAIMMSAGQAVSSDIMAMPLVWILPLGAFLVGYMTAFSGRPENDITRNLKIPQAGLLILAAVTASSAVAVNPIVAVLAVISIGLVTHGLMRQAYESRPEPNGLGSFYLSLALGGAAAGVLVGIVSPLIFDWRWELPLSLFAAAFLLRPTLLPSLPDRPWARIAGRFITLAAIGAGILSIFLQTVGEETVRQSAGVLLVCIAAAIRSTGRPVRFAAWTLWLLLSMGLVSQGIRSMEGDLRRSYYGVMSIEETSSDEGESLILAHGSTVHGLQMREDPTLPTSYYTPTSGLGDAMRALGTRDRPTIEVAGLGAGTMACLAPRDSRLVFLEIDPEIVKAATEDFTFLSRCAPDARILIGDARLLVERGDETVDAIVLDAFTSDAVPMHLITTEALDSYVSRLSRGGWLILHVSNRYLDVSSPIASWARSRGHQAKILDDSKATAGSASRSVWMAVRPDGWRVEENGWKADPRWSDAEGNGVWTDDRSSVLDIIRNLQ